MTPTTHLSKQLPAHRPPRRSGALGFRLPRTLLFLLSLSIATVPVWSFEDKNVLTMYHGTEPHPVEILPGTIPPYIKLDPFLMGLGIQPGRREEHRLVLDINQRDLTIDLNTHDAYYGRTKAPFSIQERDGALYVQTLHLVKVFSDLLGVQLIYDRPSRSLHVPKIEDVVATIRTHRRGERYQISVIYNQGLRAPKVEKIDRSLLLKIPRSPVIIDKTRMEPNEAITSMEVFTNLPDGSTEILFQMGPGVSSYTVDPFSPNNPRTLIDLRGDFTPESEIETGLPIEKQVGIQRIVIDPGHGGMDRGALGPTGLKEKDVVLDLAKRLKHQLDMLGTYAVKLTRDDDIFLSLKTRTAIANHYKADLFISIHVNAVKQYNAKGSETYYLSMDSDVDPDEFYHYHEFEGATGHEEEEEDPIGDDLTMMLWDMAQAKHLEDSFRLAKYIQEELNKLAGIRSRGVKQAPLKVLKGATMPAILFEAAFISNPLEEKKLKESLFKNQVAEAVARAIQNYDGDVKAKAQRGLLVPVEDPEP
ncbi:N-acetylmuramoyl-L-alanine amidase [Sulfidibacter corallicola]